MNPPSAQLLEVRQYLRVVGIFVASVAVLGAVSGYAWVRSKRGKELAHPDRLPDLLLTRIRKARAGPSSGSLPLWSSLYAILVLLTFLDVISFLAANVYFGGDALSGTTSAGRFYVRSHGLLTEVSQTVFVYSKWHERSVWLLFVLWTSATVVALAARRFGEHPQGPGDDHVR